MSENQGTDAPCFVLPYAAADGPAHMALDEAMLEAAARDGTAYLRFYEWAEPTLSLGYFQRIAEVRADPRWRGRPIVRRPTGGGAIWHHHELTYALAVPSGSPFVRPNTALYRAVHGAIAGLLAGRGVAAARRGEVEVEGPGPPSAENPRSRPLLCFTGRDPEDIVGMGHKWVGSAQRRRDGAVLQHGSVLLARSPDVPELLGVCDVAELSRSPRDWEEPIRRRVAAALGLEPVAIDPPGRLRDRAAALEGSTYRDPAWTGAR